MIIITKLQNKHTFSEDWKTLVNVPWLLFTKLCLTLQPHGLQHAKLFCPQLSPGVCSNSCPLSQWYYPTISSSVNSSSSCPQSFPEIRLLELCPGFFPESQLFESGGQSFGASASAIVLPMNIQDWFPLGLTSWISLQSKGLSRVFSNTTVQKHQFFSAQPSLWSNSHMSNSYMTTGKPVSLTVLCLVDLLCPTLNDPWTVVLQATLSMGILQARMLEWVAILSYMGSSQLRDQTQVSCIASRFFTIWTTSVALTIWTFVGKVLPQAF